MRRFQTFSPAWNREIRLKPDFRYDEPRHGRTTWPWPAANPRWILRGDHKTAKFASHVPDHTAGAPASLVSNANGLP
jgi:hypothetical protein